MALRQLQLVQIRRLADAIIETLKSLGIDYHLDDFTITQFSRSNIIAEIGTANATANFKNGVLEVTMDATEVSKNRKRLEIQSKILRENLVKQPRRLAAAAPFGAVRGFEQAQNRES